MKLGLVQTVFVLACSGCASTLTGQLNEGAYDKRAEHFAHVQPNDTELATGNLSEADKVIANMHDWINQSYKDRLSPESRKSFEQRMRASIRRYRLLVADKVADPTVALAVLLPEIRSNDQQVNAKLRDITKSVQRLRQDEQTRAKTYRRAHKDIEVSSSAFYADGQKVAGHESVRDNGIIGNCVFATERFSSDDKQNSTFAVRFTKGQPVHVRCYADQDLAAIPAGAHVIATTTVGHAVWDFDLGSRFKDQTTSIDFELLPKHLDVQGGGELTAVKVELRYVWAPDNVIVLDKTGHLRLRPDWKQRRVANGAFLLDQAQ